MKFDVLSLFPEMFEPIKQSIIGRAEKNNLIEKKINNHETEYFLTSKGMKLNKVLYELIIFALDTHEGDFYTNEEIIFIKETYISILKL